MSRSSVKRLRHPAHHVGAAGHEPLVLGLPGAPARAARVVGLLDRPGPVWHRMRRIGDVLVERRLARRWAGRTTACRPHGGTDSGRGDRPVGGQVVERAPSLGPGVVEQGLGLRSALPLPLSQYANHGASTSLRYALRCPDPPPAFAGDGLRHPPWFQGPITRKFRFAVSPRSSAR